MLLKPKSLLETREKKRDARKRKAEKMREPRALAPIYNPHQRDRSNLKAERSRVPKAGAH